MAQSGISQCCTQAFHQERSYYDTWSQSSFLYTLNFRNKEMERFSRHINFHQRSSRGGGKGEAGCSAKGRFSSSQSQARLLCSFPKVLALEAVSWLDPPRWGNLLARLPWVSFGEKLGAWGKALQPGQPSLWCQDTDQAAVVGHSAPCLAPQEAQKPDFFFPCFQHLENGADGNAFFPLLFTCGHLSCCFLENTYTQQHCLWINNYS